MKISKNKKSQTVQKPSSVTQISSLQSLKLSNAHDFEYFLNFGNLDLDGASISKSDRGDVGDKCSHQNSYLISTFGVHEFQNSRCKHPFTILLATYVANMLFIKTQVFPMLPTIVYFHHCNILFGLFFCSNMWMFEYFKNCPVNIFVHKLHMDWDNHDDIPSCCISM